MPTGRFTFAQTQNEAMSHTLFELNEFIRRVVALNFPQPLWIRAELADVKVSKGHFYLDLVEKRADSEEIIAQSQAVIWSKNHRQLQRKIGTDLDALLQAGMEILFLAKAEFHERFGLKLMVEDIDPAHTLGKLELQRRETIRLLKSLNLLEKNGQLPLRPVLQRLAVLSSERAAGFQDFTKHLAANAFGYRFNMQVFQVAVQGVQVEREVIAQLENIAARQQEFDAVIIIRGGGAKLDLAAFDSFLLAKKAAEMPLPILTGIGHDVDETVLDLVAHASLKTPTAVADFILHRNLSYETRMFNLGLEAKNSILQTLRHKSSKLQYFSQLIEYQLKTNFRNQGLMMDYIEKEIPRIMKSRFSNAQSSLDNLEKLIRLLGPDAAFQRGFALVYKQGAQVTTSSTLEEGDEVSVQLRNGKFQATVKNTEK